MPFWYPAKRFGEASEDINLCDQEAFVKHTFLSEKLPSWNFEQCTPRFYLSAKYTPQKYSYFPDEFDKLFNKELSTNPDIASSKVCNIEPPGPSELFSSVALSLIDLEAGAREEKASVAAFKNEARAFANALSTSKGNTKTAFDAAITAECSRIMKCDAAQQSFQPKDLLARASHATLWFKYLLVRMYHHHVTNSKI